MWERAGGQGHFFFSAGIGELPKARHLWGGKSSAVGKLISCESSQGSTVCLPCFGTSCLISVGFGFVPVTHCVSLQAFSWNRACPLLWGHEVPRKRGAKQGLRNLTSTALMLMMALPVSQIVTATSVIRCVTLVVISDTTPGRCLAQLVKVFWYCENDECHWESFLGKIT